MIFPNPNKTIKNAFAGLFLLIVLGISALADDLVYTDCDHVAIDGLETEQNRAEQIIYGAGAHNYVPDSLKGVMIFVGAKRDETTSTPILFVYTNYRTAGDLFPRKFAFNQNFLAALPDAMGDDWTVSDLVAATLANDGATEAKKTYPSEATVLIDPSVRDVLPDLRFGKCKELRMTNDGVSELVGQFADDTGKMLLARQLSPPPPEARVYLTQDLEPDSDEIKSLGDYAFHKDDVVLFSFANDRETRTAIKHGALKDLAVDTENIQTGAALFKSLKRAKGKTIFLLGHVEGDDLICRESGLHVKFEDVEVFAKQQDLNVAIIGCGSGFHENGIVGSRVINSVVAVKQFENALSAQNYLDFFQRLSSQELQIVLNKHVVQKLTSTKTLLHTEGMLYSGSELNAPGGVVRVTSSADTAQ
jgi:hypothetical protein